MSVEIEKKDPLQEEIKAFIQCVKERKQPRVSGEDGKRAVEVAEMIISSMETYSRGFSS